MSGEAPIGQRITFEIVELDGGRSVTVLGNVITIHEAIELFEDALRGAGFHCPHGSVHYDATDYDAVLR